MMGSVIRQCLLLTLALGLEGHPLAPEGHAECESAGLVVYTAVFTPKWTRDLFPKQYPEFRPPAQWSRVLGMTHNADYRIFEVGATASRELKVFAETGREELLGSGSNHSDGGGGSVLDEFLLAAIKSGAGAVSADFIVDTNHSLVSLISRIVPSPDWFVGIDSLDLCADGRWVDSVTYEASPLDAGTDSGLTFTAPNWATEPQEPIFKMTSRYPRHAANSFYYPRLNDLPPIATFHIKKKHSYQLHKPADEDVKQPKSSSASTDSDTANSLTTNYPHLAMDQHHQQNDNLTWKLTKNKLMKKRSKKQKKAKGKKCELGEWSDWSPCNAPCGQSKRTRKIIKPGQICPPLLQVRTCGCTKYIFNW